MEQSGCKVQKCSSDESVPPLCFQLWEIALLVIGAVLAGVGIATITGIVVFAAKQNSARLYKQLQKY